VALRVAFVPDTLLLVPGASGRVLVAPALVAAAQSAVAWVIAAVPERVLIISPGRTAAVVNNPVPDPGASGVPGGFITHKAGVVRTGTPVGAGATAALLLLDATGWDGTTSVLVAPPGAAVTVPDAVTRSAARRSLAVVVVGSGSARHGPDAPLADDADAPAVDEFIVAAMRAADMAALGGLDPELCRRLAVTGQGPWASLASVISAAIDSSTEGEHPRAGALGLMATSVHAEIVSGASHTVARWSWHDGVDPDGRTDSDDDADRGADAEAKVMTADAAPAAPHQGEGM